MPTWVSQLEILQELVEAVKQSMVVPFRVEGPPLVYEFDEWPQINEDGTYLDEQPPQKRKRVDGDDEEAARKKRPSTGGAKGLGKNVNSSCIAIGIKDYQCLNMALYEIGTLPESLTRWLTRFKDACLCPPLVLSLSASKTYFLYINQILQ